MSKSLKATKLCLYLRQPSLSRSLQLNPAAVPPKLRPQNQPPKAEQKPRA
ncbi:hypothetical protein OIU76_011778 [Salix suchowensis]|nr:hypothetical protein OIU76_011778 [Salix suchowensis]